MRAWAFPAPQIGDVFRSGGEIRADARTPRDAARRAAKEAALRGDYLQNGVGDAKGPSARGAMLRISSMP